MRADGRAATDIARLGRGTIAEHRPRAPDPPPRTRSVPAPAPARPLTKSTLQASALHDETEPGGYSSTANSKVRSTVLLDRY